MMADNQKSCVKAFHVSCARDDPKIKYQVHEVLEWPVLGAPLEGVEVSEPAPPPEPTRSIKVELLCEAHNPVCANMLNRKSG
jgi:hypothetical protein